MNDNSKKIIKEGYIRGTGRSYTIEERIETGEIFCNTLNSYFRIARNYAQYLQISPSQLENMIYDEEMQGERNMQDRFGSSMGR